jgi:hypothetical protein
MHNLFRVAFAAESRFERPIKTVLATKGFRDAGPARGRLGFGRAGRPGSGMVFNGPPLVSIWRQLQTKQLLEEA